MSELIKKHIIVITLFLVYSVANAQNFYVISGRVVDVSGHGIPGVNIVDSSGYYGTASDIQGNFILYKVPEGNHLFAFSAIGYESIKKSISLSSDYEFSQNIVLREMAISLEQITVRTNSEAQDIRLKGYSVSVIENKRTQNLPDDINKVLNRTPGINIRESGGLGSDFNLSLNGLSGNQIRYFIDGVPMENMGSSLSLNNFSVNLIRNIEVYKGVVPVTLGADALGGAVNIVSGFRQTSFLDVASSYGSFNTHRISLNGQYADKESKYYVKSLLFFNRSANSFTMKNVPVYDLELGNFLGNQSVERFHDDFTSGMLLAEYGILDRQLADKLSIKIIAAGNRKNYQHPNNNIKRVFGGFHTKNSTVLISSDYNIEFDRFDISANFTSGTINESVVDTSTKKYNWTGDFVYREPNDPKGELLERRSLMNIDDFILRGGVVVRYTLNQLQTLSVAFSQNYLHRSGEDEVDIFNQSYKSPNFINKSILGLEFNQKVFDNSLEALLFGKAYYYKGKIITIDLEDNEVTNEPTLDNYGFGAAISWYIINNITIKSSFELAYRIPESFEILGDGIYVNPNPMLQPERSSNFNFGARFDYDSDILGIKSELNYFYRFSEDFIRFNPLGPFGEYENLNNVKSEGLEAGVNLNFKSLVTFNTNVTYQNITDQTEFDEGFYNTNYKSRVPNIPYFFGNAGAGYHPFGNEGEYAFHFYYKLRFVNDFFLTWENLGNKEDKYIIPTQFVQDFLVEFSFENGTYNISAGIFNLADAEVYDNFLIQKPGRSFNVKLRYFIK
ncbi:MAG: TonB-dependent receptor [Melioribacteraceae bacterium]|nr:MAG: TonB-dependent receptor [Melioribacteraceae bacterium]